MIQTTSKSIHNLNWSAIMAPCHWASAQHGSCGLIAGKTRQSVTDVTVMCCEVFSKCDRAIAARDLSETRYFLLTKSIELCSGPAPCLVILCGLILLARRQILDRGSCLSTSCPVMPVNLPALVRRNYYSYIGYVNSMPGQVFPWV